MASRAYDHGLEPEPLIEGIAEWAGDGERLLQSLRHEKIPLGDWDVFQILRFERSEALHDQSALGACQLGLSSQRFQGRQW